MTTKMFHFYEVEIKFIIIISRIQNIDNMIGHSR